MDGQILFAKYAFAPNKLHFCGPNSSRTIFEYTISNQQNPELTGLLTQFEGAFPYLKLIAQSNHISNPFDSRVVEAYWLGNSLLETVSLKKFYSHIYERFYKKVNLKKWLWFQKKFGLKPLSNHSFHVFEIYRLVDNIEHKTKTKLIEHINLCRISWGKVMAIENDQLKIQYQPIEYIGGKLRFANPENKLINYQIKNQSFAPNVKINDWVSFHWDWVCDILNQRQLANLKKYTFENLKFANLTI